MRYFIKFDQDGQIKSFCQMEYITEGMALPFLLREGEYAEEIALPNNLKKIDQIELHENYFYNIEKKKIEKKKK